MADKKKEGIILSLGSVNADFQVRVDQKLGETTTLLAHDFRRFSGGKAANVAYLARKLGAPALVLARVGDDDLSLQALGALEDMEIDLRYVEKVKGVTTGFSMIMVPEDGKKNIVLSTNANDAWQDHDREKVKQAIAEAPAGSVLVVDYEVPPFIVEEAIRAAHDRGFTIVLDPSPTDRVDKALFPMIDYLVPDASETESLTGVSATSADDGKKAARKLLKEGVQHAVIKLEDGGCVIANTETMLYVPPIEVEVVDTTGAGDAFAGALAVAILEGSSLKALASYGVAASHAAITTYGSQPAYPDRERLEELFNQICNNVQELHEQ
ncbi:ribokinase [Telluribacter sp. SYSU D00476]|uniref:ribokinase n=1 Tax=Telluribacter sp. SYSU D00476 TaxID=2811430 RepID=UPI001FF6CB6A|nr:ribokinase [Telluribacter sp. SYSU D00476]